MELPCFEPRLEPSDAAGRTDRLTFTTFLRSKLESVLGRGGAEPRVTTLYYPDYLAYTTVVFDRIGRGEKTVKFVAGIDAATGRAGEVDVTIPEIETRTAPDGRIVPVSVDEREAEETWDDWLFGYLNRKYRPVRRPETSLDRLELVYTPYYVVDYGEDGERYAISSLTKQTELLEDIGPLADAYREQPEPET